MKIGLYFKIPERALKGCSSSVLSRWSRLVLQIWRNYSCDSAATVWGIWIVSGRARRKSEGYSHVQEGVWRNDIHEGCDGDSLSHYILHNIMGYLNYKNTFIISHLLSLYHFFSIAAKVKREGSGLNTIGKVSIKLSLDI